MSLGQGLGLFTVALISSGQAPVPMGEVTFMSFHTDIGQPRALHEVGSPLLLFNCQDTIRIVNT